MLGGSGKKGASILHGVSLILILLVGFAMLKSPPMDRYWWMVKLVLWLFIGAAPALSKRKVLPAPIVLTLCIAAAVAAGTQFVARCEPGRVPSWVMDNAVTAILGVEELVLDGR